MSKIKIQLHKVNLLWARDNFIKAFGSISSFSSSLNLLFLLLQES